MGLDANDGLQALLANGGKLEDYNSPDERLAAIGLRRIDDDEPPEGRFAPLFGVAAAPSLDQSRKKVVARPYEWVDPAAIPRREWLYGRHLIRKFVSVDVAKGAMGKTSLMLGIAIALATGRDLYGMNPAGKRLKVWYFNLEDPYVELQRRIQAICKHFGIRAEELEGHLFINSGRDEPLVVAETNERGVTVLRPEVEDIIEQVLDLQIDVLMADPFVSSHTVNENDNSAIDKVVKQGWGAIAERGNCAVNLAHHIRKMGGTDADAESSRGAKALIDAARSTWVYNQMTPDEADRAGVDNHRRYFRVRDDKGNLAPPSEKADWYHLTSVSLGNEGVDEDGHFRPADEIGVAITWQWPDPFDAITTSDTLAIQKAVHAAEHPLRADIQANEWVGYLVADVLGWDAADKKIKTKVNTYIKTWIKNRVLEQYEGLDAKRNPRQFIRAGEWVKP